MYLFSILTVNTCTYEPIREIINPNPNIEYVCVTDNPNLQSSTWKIIYKPNIWFLYVKHHQYEFVSTDVCLWLDGSFQIIADPYDEFVKPFIESDKEFAISLHDFRHNIIEECCAWEYTRGMSKENSAAFINYVFNNHISSDTLFQTSCMLTKNTDHVKFLFQKVVELEEQCSVNGKYRDDQTILSCIAILYAYRWKGFLLMNFSNTHNNKFFTGCIHGTNTPFYSKQISFICFDKIQSNLYELPK